MCKMAPLRYLGDVVTIQRESLPIITLTIADIVIHGLREISVAGREMTCIFDKGCFSDDHVASMGTKGEGMEKLHRALDRDTWRFKEIGFLVRLFNIIFVSFT